MDQIPPQLSAVFKGVRAKHFPKGQIMLYQYDPALDVLLLQSGVIKIYDIDEQGNEKILHLLKPSAIVPLTFFSLNSDVIRWFYAALTDCVVCVVPVQKLRDQIDTDSQLATSLMQYLSNELHEILVRMSSLGKTNTRDKIVAALHFLSEHHAIERRSGWWRVSFSVNQQLLADMTGVTRESAAMIMKDLKDEHIVRQPRMTILEINRNKLPA